MSYPTSWAELLRLQPSIKELSHISALTIRAVDGNYFVQTSDIYTKVGSTSLPTALCVYLCEHKDEDISGKYIINIDNCLEHISLSNLLAVPKDDIQIYTQNF